MIHDRTDDYCQKSFDDHEQIKNDLHEDRRHKLVHLDFFLLNSIGVDRSYFFNVVKNVIITKISVSRIDTTFHVDLHFTVGINFKKKNNKNKIKIGHPVLESRSRKP